MPTSRRAVLLFGLSANPPTGLLGHAGIVRWALQQTSFEAFAGRAVDELWVLPVFVHAFEDKKEMAPFEHRMAMARLAFETLAEAHGRVRVLPIERDVQEPIDRAARPSETEPRVGTIDVVRWLMAKHPETEFGLLLGADTCRDLERGRWKESAALRALVQVVAVPRLGFPTPRSAPNEAPMLSDISSSQVRASTHPEFWARALQPSVLEYIQRHDLYEYARRVQPQDLSPRRASEGS